MINPSPISVLSFDPGAKRQGWAFIHEGPSCEASGVFGLERSDEPFQEYKLNLIEFWVKQATELLDSFKPEVVVSETVPAVGGGNFIVATQSHLASVAITTVHALAYAKGYAVKQIAANTVKSRIGKHKDASKVKVRDGVFTLLPAIKYRAPEWKAMKTFDESDAIAIGLAYLGLTNKEKIDKRKRTKT